MQKESKIKQLESDLERTVGNLRDFHSRMVKLDQFALQQTSSLQELVETKIQQQTKRIGKVTEIFKEALMLNNRTYFLEELTKQKINQKYLKTELKLKADELKRKE